MRGSVVIVYHFCAFGWYAFIVRSLMSKDEADLPAGLFVYGGPWKYLTFLNLILQMVFFGLACINDLLPRRSKSNSWMLSMSRDFLFSVFAFPVGVFVVLIFWVIFLYDRQLVYPASVDEFFPPWQNHAMHTLVLPMLLVEVILQPHSYPKTLNGMAALCCVGVAYLSWVIWVYLTVGIWVYPLLGLFSPLGLSGFFCFNMCLVMLLYITGEALNHHIWNKGKVIKQQ